MSAVIRITVRLGEPLRRTTGRFWLELSLPPGATVADLLTSLGRRYDDFQSGFRGDAWGGGYPYRLFVNRKPVARDQFSTHILRQDDVIHIALPAAGGASSRRQPPEDAAAADAWPARGAPGSAFSTGIALPHSFYARSALEVAPDLLGCLLVREWEGRRLVGRIVEVEAYLGREDAASHAFRGPTPRSQVMFGPAGMAYVYLIYGVHHCLNVVTGAPGVGQAALIRALEPLAGVEIMQRLRGREDVRMLTNGPGKLCQALGVDRRLNGWDLTAGSGLWLERGDLAGETICTSPRIGIRGADEALNAPWRFFLRDNPHLSPSPHNRRCRP